MPTVESALHEIGSLDVLASADTPLHRLDPRAKVVTAAVFIVVVVSFGKYDISRLIPFLLYPAALLAVGGLPPLYFLRKLVMLAPFVLFVGMFNPILDRSPLVQLGGVTITGGWVSYFSILFRFTLTVSAALILIASTGFYPVCLALERLRVPRPFVVQLLLLYRYLFVLTAETLRILRAYALRSGRGPRVRLRLLGSLVGQLLLRTLDRAERIHLAMRCRAFRGEFHLARPLHARPADWAFVLGWSAFFIGARLYDLPAAIGSLVTGGSL